LQGNGKSKKEDFEAGEIVFPADIDIQQSLVSEIFIARDGLAEAGVNLRAALMSFSDSIDGRFGEELPDVADDGLPIDHRG
jgi:hypothetical protein